MKEFTITSKVEVYSSESELIQEERDLLQSARETADNAYAPYSGFRVGAVLRMDNGEILTGSNQENVAYPSGLCAERVALFHAGTVFPSAAATHLVIACQSVNFEVNRPITPCGACRQVIAEYESRWGKPIRILMAGAKGEIYAVNGIGGLLPLAFEANELKR
ncbi:MAG: cytidine deaminase [Bacteroidia bacterium]|nr:cytidine deaminase [Bacteroidia bacterium]